jgi:DNA polymerase III epsilon subunit family exonuclease
VSSDRSLLDRLEAELARAGRAVPLASLAPALLRTGPGPLASKVLERLVEGDGRFAIEEGAVRLVPSADPLLEVPVRDLRFAVIDFETNGLSPFDRAIEVGVACFQGGQEVDHFQTLLNPGTPLSSFVVKLTGIRPEDLEGRPAFAEVRGRVESLLAGAVTVAHNLPFDRRILRREIQLAGGSKPPVRPSLCTLALSRKLLPGEESRGLDALADRFSITVTGRHRALGDARAAGALLYKLLDLASEKAEVKRWRDLKAFVQGTPSRRPAGRPAGT